MWARNKKLIRQTESGLYHPKKKTILAKSPILTAKAAIRHDAKIRGEIGSNQYTLEVMKCFDKGCEHSGAQRPRCKHWERRASLYTLCWETHSPAECELRGLQSGSPVLMQKQTPIPELEMLHVDKQMCQASTSLERLSNNLYPQNSGKEILYGK